ncbi:MAG: hypothetical protein EON58_10720 [Alphaproteobacteria bacterium]|nr:MAG: hypothetical protein EON58_10720 [Alphaproteobacteria bacterium]
MRTPDIPLTAEELALFSQIHFDWKSHEDLRNSLDPMEALASSLLARDAIPEVRLSYFTDPDFNPGGRGKSRQSAFEKNAPSGDDVLRHPQFLRYLEYFICGPDLPATAIDKFKSESWGGRLTGSDVNDLTPHARAFVREYRLDPHRAAEEFFKLAVECGAMPGFAENVLKSVRAVKLP